MNETPQSSRIHIAVFGRRNAGKSSLINALTNQPVALVSAQPGTTTDPVSKSMELLPLGPVVLIDTAGLDDSGELGVLRVKRSYEVLHRSDLAILVIDGVVGLTGIELEILQIIQSKKIPFVIVVNKIDQADLTPACLQDWGEILPVNPILVSTVTGAGISNLKEALIRQAPNVEQELLLVGDLAPPGEPVILVVPIDKAAPKGRLILPQQQVIRDLLEHDAIAVVTKEQELRETLATLGRKPALVITDSQAFLKVAADTPKDIPMTSFSILFARQKGDLLELAEGAKTISALQPGDRVLIAEGCTHHRQSDDIGTVKIPRWLRQMVGGELTFQWSSGFHLPDNLREFKLIVHCGACMLSRREMLYRLSLVREQGIPIVNYGILIAYVHGLLPRVLEPFPEVKRLFSS
jgi:[FeFe] hydrogenase H-cluster maturation GTPase HydF